MTFQWWTVKALFGGLLPSNAPTRLCCGSFNHVTSWQRICVHTEERQKERDARMWWLVPMLKTLIPPFPLLSSCATCVAAYILQPGWWRWAGRDMQSHLSSVGKVWA